MNIKEIDATISQCLSLARKGDIEKALKMLDNCGEQCDREENSPDEGFAKLFRSIGHLHYIRKDRSMALVYYLKAVEWYSILARKGNKAFEEDYYRSNFHLGCCDPKFFDSQMANTLRSELFNGVSNPGSFLGSEYFMQVEIIGHEMFIDMKKLIPR